MSSSCPRRPPTILVTAMLAFSLGLPTSCLEAVAQEIQLGDTHSASSAARRQHVVLDTDSLTVTAARPEWVEVRFEIDPGLHINSHTPHDELLVPTALELHAADVKVMGQEYPAGIPMHLDVGAGETLSTYQGQFRVRLQLVAPKGESVLTGTLHYQACDARSCFPPRSLPVQIQLRAR